MHGRPSQGRPPSRSRAGAPARRKGAPKAPRNSRIAWWLAASAIAVTALAVRQRARQAEHRHPPVGRIIEVDGVRVHYAGKGKGQPVVLLNGNGTMVHDWMISGLFDRLARDYRVIAIDRPGYGYTGRPRNRLWTASAQARLLKRTLDQLGVEDPILVGHSWGTAAALACALEHPDEVGGLVLLSGYYYPTKRADVWMFAAPAIPVVGDVMRYTVSPALTRLLAPRIIRKLFEPAPVPRRFSMRFPLRLSLRPWQLRASAEDSAFMVPAAASMQNRYRELRMPVAIVTGDGDCVVTPSRQSMRLHREIEESDLTVLPGLGHMVHYAAHDEIAEAVGGVAARMRERDRAQPVQTTGRPIRHSVEV
jgi:pimeloyl-ACP methyl ester carboxylesterase